MLCKLNITLVLSKVCFHLLRIYHVLLDKKVLILVSESSFIYIFLDIMESSETLSSALSMRLIGGCLINLIDECIGESSIF